MPPIPNLRLFNTTTMNHAQQQQQLHHQQQQQNNRDRHLTPHPVFYRTMMN